MSHRRRILRSKPAKEWRVDEPPIVVQPCRHALTLAIRTKSFAAANRISEKRMQKTYERLPKPSLVALLSRMIEGPL